MQARVCRKLLDRIEALPQTVRDIAWKGQRRMCQRHRRLIAAGKPKVVATTAIVREMAGFIRVIARTVTPAHARRSRENREDDASTRPMRGVGDGKRRGNPRGLP